jgi:hypothetical protein
MFIWRVSRESCPMYSLETLQIYMSYVFSSNSSYSMSYVFSLYKHVLCTLFKLFIYTCIWHVYMKSLKRIHRTCLYEEFEENTYDMFIWRVWKECIRHVYMKSLKRIHRTCLHMSYVFSSKSSYKHVLCILFKLFI